MPVYLGALERGRSLLFKTPTHVVRCVDLVPHSSPYGRRKNSAHVAGIIPEIPPFILNVSHETRSLKKLRKLTRLDPRGSSPPGTGAFRIREATQLRGIYASQFCSGGHQSMRILTDRKPKKCRKKLDPSAKFSHWLKLKSADPVSNPWKISAL